jgi:hypothetical protein
MNQSAASLEVIHIYCTTRLQRPFFQSQINSGYAFESYVSMFDLLFPSTSSSCAWRIPFVFSDYNSMCILLVFLSPLSRCSNVHCTTCAQFFFFFFFSYFFRWRLWLFFLFCFLIRGVRMFSAQRVLNFFFFLRIAIYSADVKARSFVYATWSVRSVFDYSCSLLVSVRTYEPQN